MFNKLGDRYRKIVIVPPTQSVVERIEAIINFAKDISEESPQLYNLLKRFDNGDKIEWEKVDDADLNAIYSEILKAVQAVAPEGTDFSFTEDHSMAFVPNDDVLDPDIGKDGVMKGGMPVMEGRHIKEVMDRVTQRVIERLYSENK